MTTIFIGLGANMPSADYGSPRKTLEAAVVMLQEKGLELLAIAPWYESEPVPVSGQPWYINGVMMAETTLSALEVMSLLLNVETAFGRVREEKWAPRIIDLDLLAYDDHILPSKTAWKAAEKGEELCVPHPHMHERRFVLAPLVDIAPEWVHPVLNISAQQLLAGLPIEGIVRRMAD